MNELLDPFKRLLEQHSDSAAVRRVEADGDTASIWAAVRESGFLDAILPESAGGFGLTLTDVAPLLIAAGEHALPVAFGETMVARALIAAAGLTTPVDTAILLWPLNDAGKLASTVAPAIAGATHALVQRGEQTTLQPLRPASDARDGFGFAIAGADLDAAPLLTFQSPAGNLLCWAAALAAGAMAGALRRTLELSLSHVNERQQFGRPIAKLQAIQQQMSVMAEQVVAADVAARIALSGTPPVIGPLNAAVGKSVADDAAALACAIAHAVHGAIGISAEHDLQLHVRRLKRARLSFGSGPYWAGRIGAARLQQTEGTSVDFLREHFAQPIVA